MRTIYLPLFAVMLLSSCNSNSKYKKITEAEPIDIIIGENKGEYRLENVMEIQKVIPLEATSDSYLIQIEKIIEHENKLFVLDELTNRLLVFSNNGKYLYAVGKKGSGPGEFQNIVDFSLHIDEQELVALDIEKRALLKFDIHGNFIKEVRLPFQGYRFSIHHDKMAFYTGYFNEDNSNLIITDLNGRILDRLFIFEPNRQLMKFNFTGGITSNKNGFLYSDAASNSIYQVEDTGIALKYRVDFGQQMWQEEDLMKHEDFFEAVMNGELNFLRKDYEETESAIVFEFNQYDKTKIGTKFTNNPRIALYSKRDSMTYSPENFPNNVLYTVISGPKGVLENDFFVSILDPSRLAGAQEKEAELSNILKDRFNIDSNFDSEKNPVLIIYRIL